MSDKIPKTLPEKPGEKFPPLFSGLEQKIRDLAAQGRLKKPLIIVAAIVLVVASGAAFYFHQQYAQLKRDPRQEAAKEVQKMVAQISRLISLPQGETPTLATVADPEKLKGQAFFARAKKGDKILIYTQARRAYLYSPADNKLIDVAPLDIRSTPAPAVPTPTPKSTR